VIKDLYDHTLYSASENYERFKDYTITFHSVKIQNQQDLPIWLEISSNGLSFSSWIFPWEVEEHLVYPGSYDLTVYYCDDPSASFSEISTNGTSVTYSLSVSSDTALLISGYMIGDVFGNLMSLTTDLNDVNDTIHAAINLQTQNLTVQIDATNSNINIVANDLNILDSSLDGNFTLISQTLNMLNSALDGNFTLIFDTLNALDNSFSGNFTAITQTLNLMDSSLNGNFTLISQTLNMLNSALNGNFTLISETLNILDSSLDGNFTIVINTLTMLNNALDGNITLVTDLLNIMDSSLEGNFTILTDLLDIMDSSLNGNFTLISETLNILDSSLDGNFTIVTTTLTMLNNALDGNFTLLIDTLNLLENNMNANFTIIANTLNILDSSLNGNFTLISQTLNMLNSALDGNFTLISETLNILDSSLDGNFTLIFDTLNAIDTNLLGNFSILINEMNLIDSNLAGNFTLLVDTLAILDSNLDGNFTLLMDQLIMTNSSILGNVTIISQMIDILDSNLAANFTSQMTFLDLSNSTQITLLIQNYQGILAAQEYAAEYMSELHIETIPEPQFSDQYITFEYSTNWGNTTISIWDNMTLVVLNATESDIIQFLKTEGYGTHFLYFEIYAYSPETGPLVINGSYTYYVSPPPVWDIIYTIQVYDIDGYIFTNFPLWPYYDGYALSNWFLILNSSINFNPGLISFRNYWNESCNIVDYNVTITFNNQVLIQYRVDLVYFNLENTGDYQVKVIMTNKDNTNQTYITFVPAYTEKKLWLASGNYTYKVYEMIPENPTNENQTISFDSKFLFIGAMTIRKSMTTRSFDVSSTKIQDVAPVNIISRNPVASGIIGGSIFSFMLIGLVSKFGGEAWTDDVLEPIKDTQRLLFGKKNNRRDNIKYNSRRDIFSNY